jgi:hypothetical protein
MTPARITYASLGQLTDLARFVQLFEACLKFDDEGLTFERGKHAKATSILPLRT